MHSRCRKIFYNPGLFIVVIWTAPAKQREIITARIIDFHNFLQHAVAVFSLLCNTFINIGTLRSGSARNLPQAPPAPESTKKYGFYLIWTVAYNCGFSRLLKNFLLKNFLSKNSASAFYHAYMNFKFIFGSSFFMWWC